jgi:hypothetical protein
MGLRPAGVGHASGTADVPATSRVDAADVFPSAKLRELPAGGNPGSATVGHNVELDLVNYIDLKDLYLPPRRAKFWLKVV